MKILIFIIIIFAFLGGLAWAAPFLVCDPQAGVQYYKVDLDGVIFDNVRTETQPDGSIKFDLAGVSNGAHIVKLAACVDNWGCSGWSVEFPFTKPVLAIPDGITIIP